MTTQKSELEHSLKARTKRSLAELFPIALAAAVALPWTGLRDAHAALSAEPVAVEAPEADPAASPAPAEAAVAPSRRRIDARGVTLEGRVMLMAKELDLNAAQQAQVTKLLQAQRQQVAAAWSDASVPAALRVNRTQVIGDRTADQIRALLNDTQREKYIKPRVRDATVGAAGASLESWTAPGKAR